MLRTNCEKRVVYEAVLLTRNHPKLWTTVNKLMVFLMHRVWEGEESEEAQWETCRQWWGGGEPGKGNYRDNWVIVLQPGYDDFTCVPLLLSFLCLWTSYTSKCLVFQWYFNVMFKLTDKQLLNPACAYVPEVITVTCVGGSKLPPVP